MKTKIPSVGLTIAIVGSLLAPAAFSQGTFDLKAFKGTFRGPVLIQQAGGGTLSGNASASFVVPASGKSARVNYRAIIPDGMGGSDIFPTVLSLAPNKQANVTDLLVGIAGTNNAKKGRGRWSQRRRVLTVNANNGEGISLRVTATSRDVASQRLVTLKMISTDPGGTNVFTNRLKGRRP